MEPNDPQEQPGKDGREHDKRVGHLVSEYLDRLNRGEKLNPLQILAEHPDVGGEVLKDLETYIALGAGDSPPATLGTLGDYTLRRKIGSGGMGVVYEAWQDSMDRRVALKVLPAGMASDDKALQRFFREARTAGKLSHPNIVNVYGMGVEGGTPYYSMEFVEGETLAQILERTGSRSSEEPEGESAPARARPGSRHRGRQTSEEEARRRLSPILGLFRKPESGRRSKRLEAQAEEAARDAATLPVGVEGSRPQPESAEAPEDGSTPGGDSVPARGRVPGPLAGETILESEEITAAYSYRVAEAFAEVAGGLQHAHERGIVHRDIKPSNLILDQEGRLRILDFGLAHLEGQQSLTRSGDLIGTVLYMSPEQAMARRIPIDHRTDIYSLGATLYEMLAWSPPFHGKTYQETLSSIVLRDPQLPRKLNPRIPRDLETIVLKCLRKDPGDRYGTAEALAQDLRRFVKGDPIEARPQAPLERIARRAWRERVKVGAACFLVLLLLASGLLLLRYRRDLEAENFAAYREKIFGAIGKMELGRPGRRVEGRSAQAVLPRSAPTGSDVGSAGLLSAVYAAEAQLPDVVPDPVEEAADDLRQAAELFPRRPEAHFYLARAEKLLGHDEPAKEALDRALACEPGFFPALIEQESASGRSEEEVAARLETALAAAGQAGIVRDSVLAYLARAKREWKKAEEALGRLLAWCEAGPESPEPYLGFHMRILLQRGQARLEMGDPGGAVEDFVTARALWPKLAQPVLLLGKTYHIKGETARAEARFEEFHARTSRKDEFALKVALVYQELREYERGLVWAEKAAESAQQQAVRAGILVIGLGRKEEGLVAADKAVELDPELSSAHHARALALQFQGKFVEAEAEYRQAILLDPEAASAHSNLGIALSAQGKNEEAELEDRKAIQLDPNDTLNHSNLGGSLYHQGRFKEAEVECLEAIRLDSKNASAHSLLGIALSAQGKHAEAELECRAAIGLDQDDAEAHSGLGIVLGDQGKRGEAIEEFRVAIRLGTRQHSPYCNYAQLLREQGKLREALAVSVGAVETFASCSVTLDHLAALLRQLGQIDGGSDIESIARDLEKGLFASSSSELLAPGAPEVERRLKALALALVCSSPVKDPEMALEVARRLAEKGDPLRPDGLGFVAEIQLRGGKLPAAIETLERLASLPGASLEHRAQFEEYRKAALPDLPTPGSVDAALERPEVTPIIAKGAEWRFFRGKTKPSEGLEWTQVDFDDSGWEKGPSGFGYGDGDHATVLDDMKGGYTTVYIRHAFDVADPGALKSLTLRGIVDDGCVVYLNGTEVGRVCAGPAGRELAHDALASENAKEPPEVMEAAVDPTLLRERRNVLAIQGLNVELDSSDFSLIGELVADYVPHRREVLRLHRALRALEIVGSQEAHSVLKALSEEGPWPPGGPEARSALERLMKSTQPVSEAPKAAERSQSDGEAQDREAGAAREPLRVYAQDFEAEVGPEWSKNKTDVTPNGGRKFLGQLGNDRVTLSLEGLPEHRLLRISFELFVIRSWDGNAEGGGPDVLDVRVNGGALLLYTTFASALQVPGGKQAYPDSVIAAEGNAAFTGAFETSTLGFTHLKRVLDAVYALRLTFPHASPSVKLEFSASGLEDLDNESWGLDNVVVEALPDVEPLSAEEKAQLWEDLGSRDALKANAALWRIAAAADEGAAYIGARLEAAKAEREAARREVLDFESKRFEPFRTLAREREAERAGLLAYLEGRLLQRRGEHREAAAKLEGALAAGLAKAEPCLRLVESLRALGEPDRAEKRLREALRSGAVDSREVWDAWWALATAEAKLPAEEILKVVSEAGAARPESYATDVLWALDRLREEGAIRINCGGDEYGGTDGKLWGKDRFARGGTPRVAPRDRPVEGTDEDDLYRAGTAFFTSAPGSHGYRIPLPLGRYRVTLGFAEVALRESGKRHFDAFLEGRKVLEDYEPKIDRAENFTFEQSVEDGHLDLEFVHKLGNPKISAIAIERLP